MKKQLTLTTALFLGLTSMSAFAQDWIEGVYINQDTKSFMKEVIFCKDGKAYSGMSPRKYEVVSKNNETHIVLNSNGVFTFKLSNDKKELFPVDEFTTKWFTKKSLKLDANRKDTCNW
jgi:hypothetical protein